MSTYVYGIVRAEQPELPKETDGIGDPPQPVRTLTEGELAAVVSDAPEELSPQRRDLLAHQHVLTLAAEHGTVLPLRFGSLSPDDDAVRGVLAERTGHYLERLRELEGKIEYNVKAVHNEEAVLREVMDSDPELREFTKAARESGGGTYEQRLKLGEMVAGAVRQREERDAPLVAEELAPAAAEASSGPAGQGWLSNVSFLVDRDDADRFVAAVRRLGEEHPQLEVQAYGPLPPYSFVERGPADGPAQ
ncbi:GvpL/GvpF family gas vesicle protein [Streptomyces sp. A7024]|uniref:GvpL/GvpF family gas vesicle protein n=1 Tax=Streptomyces coryli TaxID=1128680 RepID=A0A6G4U493_9ACTN|nr:GvpL/GvpF family gas vesicle protein [Streptomyces coryli]